MTKYKSIKDGKWNDEDIWRPRGIPEPDDRIVFRHRVESG